MNPSVGAATPEHELRLHLLGRARTEQWNRLRDAGRRLARGVESDDQVALLQEACAYAFSVLLPIEKHFAFPGHRTVSQLKGQYDGGQLQRFAQQITRLVRLLSTGTFRRLDLLNLRLHDYADLLSLEEFSDSTHKKIQHERRPYFEVLVVDDLTPREESDLQLRLRELRQPDDAFIYEVVVARTFEDGLLTVLANPNIQCCVLRYAFPFRDGPYRKLLEGQYQLTGLDREAIEAGMPGERTLMLGRAIKTLRPELDVFLVTDAPAEDLAGEATQAFRRVFYHGEDYRDLHMSIMKGVDNRFETPFFSALRKYALKPTGVFHALPISRGKSIAKSHWIRDLEEFYGPRAFQGETSATTGGLDSLLQPVGTIKRAQECAARAFGARHTYFVTNGTSTANKIVMQALMRPGDIILLSHDCHKSHPYAVILAGARPVYLDAYPLPQYSMYGAVPLRRIKQRLLELKRAGKLDRVKLLLLTNITFDGIGYDPVRVMEEVLAIKPDMVFLWDEAWFAYGRFSPTLRERSAMAAASLLRERYRSESYRAEYQAWRQEFDARDQDDDETWLGARLMADPDRVKLRVYATHSTHKTLTALRQGSMIHVHDEDFEQGVRVVFHEAFMTHTSTSPNYQILGSLDIGRRQVELEGYDLVLQSIQVAITLRERIRSDPLLQRYFRVLGPKEMIPDEYRPSELEAFYRPGEGWTALEQAWQQDEFVLDPTRLTVDVGRTGMDGDQFKKMLMERFDIQINKTSRNTVLFMVHIGTSRGTAAHLVKVLTMVARELAEQQSQANRAGRALFEGRVHRLVEELPPLPYFSRFHQAFRVGDADSRDGDMRSAFFLAYDDESCDYLTLSGVQQALDAGAEVVSASFVTPYPPGFPILVPGQVVTQEILSYLLALDVKEIHGYEPAYGLRIFTSDALAGLMREASPSRAEREMV